MSSNSGICPGIKLAPLDFDEMRRKLDELSCDSILQNTPPPLSREPTPTSTLPSAAPVNSDEMLSSLTGSSKTLSERTKDRLRRTPSPARPPVVTHFDVTATDRTFSLQSVPSDEMTPNEDSEETTLDHLSKVARDYLQRTSTPGPSDTIDAIGTLGLSPRGERRPVSSSSHLIQQNNSCPETSSTGFSFCSTSSPRGTRGNQSSKKMQADFNEFMQHSTEFTQTLRPPEDSTPKSKKGLLARIKLKQSKHEPIYETTYQSITDLLARVKASIEKYSTYGIQPVNHLSMFKELSNDSDNPLLQIYRKHVAALCSWISPKLLTRTSPSSKVKITSNPTHDLIIASLKASACTPDSFNLNYTDQKRAQLMVDDHFTENDRERTQRIQSLMFLLFNSPTPDLTSHIINFLNAIGKPAVLKTLEWNPAFVLKDELGKEYTNKFSSIKPAEFFRGLPHAMSLEIVDISNKSDPRILLDCSPASIKGSVEEILPKILPLLDQTFSDPLLGMVDQVQENVDVLPLEIVRNGIYANDGIYGLLKPDEIAAVRNERMEAFCTLTASSAAPFADTSTSQGIVEEHVAKTDSLDSTASSAATFADTSTSQGIVEERVAKTDSSDQPKTLFFDELLPDIACKKLFPSKKAELIYILQLLSINACRFGDLRFKAEFPLFGSYFGFATHLTEKMRYRIEYISSTHWNVIITKYVTIRPQKRLDMPIGTDHTCSVAEMGYTFKMTVNPFEPGIHKVSAGDVNIFHLQFNLSDAPEKALKLYEILCLGKDYSRTFQGPLSWSIT